MQIQKNSVLGMMTSVFYQKTGGWGNKTNLPITSPRPCKSLCIGYNLFTNMHLQVHVIACHCMLGLRLCQLELQLLCNFMEMLINYFQAIGYISHFFPEFSHCTPNLAATRCQQKLKQLTVSHSPQEKRKEIALMSAIYSKIQQTFRRNMI